MITPESERVALDRESNPWELVYSGMLTGRKKDATIAK